MKTKMKIYKSAVGSLFTYGSEAWCLSETNLRSLNGANAGCLHRFSGKTRVEEAREASSTYSLCKDIRSRRLSWLGHILRMKDNQDGTRRLVKIAANVQFEMGGGGNLLMDAPKMQHFDDLVALAEDRKEWKKIRLTKFGQDSEARKAKTRTTRQTKKTKTSSVASALTERIVSVVFNRIAGSAKNTSTTAPTLSSDAKAFFLLNLSKHY